MTGDEAPNLFSLRGDGTEITYTAAGPDGKPQLRYAGPAGTRELGGADVRHLETRLGTEVAVTLSQVPDGNSIDLVLLLPPFGPHTQTPTTFKTLAILVTDLGSFIGTPPGADSNYAPVALTGEAEFIET